jgi:hypothetical protein
MSTQITRKIMDMILRNDFGTFVAPVFDTLSPSDPYVHNWHIDAIAHELMQIHRGRVRRLITNHLGL